MTTVGLAADVELLHRCTKGKMSCLATGYPIGAGSDAWGTHLKQIVLAVISLLIVQYFRS